MKSNDYLAEIVSEISSTPLSNCEEEEVRYKLLDWMGCVIGGAVCHKPAALIQQRSVVENGATFIGASKTGTVVDAAFCNAFSASYLEFDDTHKLALSHPGALNIAVAIAACESEECNFYKLFLAIISGYEVMLRLGAAINPSHYEVWHTTGTCGVFGATAAACLAYGMQTSDISRAFGLASNMSTGFRFTFGTDAKTASAAHAAMCGVLAADMARLGFSAPDEILEHALLPIMAKDVTAESLTEQSLNQRFWLNCAYKSYASCGHTHTALDCWNLLLNEHKLSADDIERVTVCTFSVAKEATGTLKCFDPVQARFSIPYCLSALLITGEVTPKVFAEEYLNDPQIICFAQKVNVISCKECDRKYPALRPAKIVVLLKNGKTIEKSLDISITTPPRNMLRRKYRALVTQAIGKNAMEKLEALILYGDSRTPVKKLTTFLRNLEFSYCREKY